MVVQAKEKVMSALTAIKGIGRRYSSIICEKVKPYYAPHMVAELVTVLGPDRAMMLQEEAKEAVPEDQAGRWTEFQEMQVQMKRANEDPAKSHSFKILVKGAGKTTITVDVQASDTIAAVKAKIQDKVCLEQAPQILIFASKQLEDDRVLSDYNVGSGDQLTVDGRVRGGVRAETEEGLDVFDIHSEDGDRDQPIAGSIARRILATLDQVNVRLSRLERAPVAPQRAQLQHQPLKPEPAVSPSADGLAASLEDALRDGTPLQCRVDKFFEEKGYGFATWRGSQIFVHKTRLKPESKPCSGQSLVVEVSKDDQGRLRAATARTLQEWETEWAMQQTLRAAIASRAVAAQATTEAEELRRRLFTSPPGLEETTGQHAKCEPEEKEPEEKVPMSMTVVSPNYQRVRGGIYEFVVARTKNGLPVWKQVGGDNVIYNNSQHKWLIGPEAEMEAEKGGIWSKEQHGGCLPHKVAKWLYSKDAGWKDDEDIKVSVSQKLAVTAQQQQLEATATPSTESEIVGNWFYPGGDGHAYAIVPEDGNVVFKEGTVSGVLSQAGEWHVAEVRKNGALHGFIRLRARDSCLESQFRKTGEEFQATTTASKTRQWSHVKHVPRHLRVVSHNLPTYNNVYTQQFETDEASKTQVPVLFNGRPIWAFRRDGVDKYLCLSKKGRWVLTDLAGAENGQSVARTGGDDKEALPCKDLQWQTFNGSTFVNDDSVSIRILGSNAEVTAAKAEEQEKYEALPAELAGGYREKDRVIAQRDITIVGGKLAVLAGTAGIIRGAAETDPVNRIAVDFVKRQDGKTACISCVALELNRVFSVHGAEDERIEAYKRDHADKAALAPEVEGCEIEKEPGKRDGPTASVPAEESAADPFAEVKEMIKETEALTEAMERSAEADKQCDLVAQHSAEADDGTSGGEWESPERRHPAQKGALHATKTDGSVATYSDSGSDGDSSAMQQQLNNDKTILSTENASEARALEVHLIASEDGDTTWNELSCREQLLAVSASMSHKVDQFAKETGCDLAATQWLKETEDEDAERIMRRAVEPRVKNVSPYVQRSAKLALRDREARTQDECGRAGELERATAEGDAARGDAGDAEADGDNGNAEQGDGEAEDAQAADTQATQGDSDADQNGEEADTHVDSWADEWDEEEWAQT